MRVDQGLERLGTRLALAEVGDGAVLVDLSSGDIHRLNHTATVIFQRLVKGEAPDDLAWRLATEWSAESSVIRDDIIGLVDTLTRFQRPSGGETIHPVGPHWSTHADGDILSTPGGAWLRYLPDSTALEVSKGVTQDQLRTLLLWAVPHILMAQGQLVLHAAAVCLEGRGVHAFIGASGAGKTTTATVLARSNRRLVSEDLVLVASGMDHGRVVVWMDGERHVRAWVHEQLNAARVMIDVTNLAARVCVGSCETIERILLVDSSQRRGGSFEFIPVDTVSACVELMRNSFAERGRPSLWRFVLERSAILAESGCVRRLSCPEGIDLLESAAGGYSTISIS